MYPVLFEIPGLGFPLRSFGVLVAGGMFLAIWIWGRLLLRHGDEPEEDALRSSQVALWVVVGILAGARLLYIVVESSRYLSADRSAQMEAYLDDRSTETAALLTRSDPDGLAKASKIAVGHSFLSDPLRALKIWEGGLVMYGGLFGSILLGLWSSRKHGLEPWNAFDTCMVAGFFGLAVGRWGCLLVGDDFGSVVPATLAHLPFPITVRVPSAEWLSAHEHSLFPHALAGQKLWATQVWMSLNAIVVGLVGMFVLARRSWRGQAAAVVFIHYGITRFVIEMFRGDEIRGVWFGGALSTSQLISIAGIALGAWMLLKRPGPPVLRPETSS